MKELQGQFEIDFEKWWIENMDQEMSVYTFYQLDISLQFGAVQLFADSVMYEICTKVNHDDGRFIGTSNTMHFICKTRPEAHQEAVSQFIKWYNENN